MVSRYSFVRYKWFTPVELDVIEKEYSSFKITKLIHERVANEVSLYKDQRDEIEAQADTLQAFLSAYRAVLNQREAKPFTSRDMELRSKVLKMYPENRPTPFPWEFNSEPEFQVA